MRILYFLLLFLFAFQTASAQRTKSEKFKNQVLVYPTLPVEGFQKIGFKIYYPDKGITIDTLRRYMGNMDLLRGGETSGGYSNFQSLHPVEMVNEGWDILVEMAIANDGIQKKEMQSYEEDLALFGLSTIYYYNVTLNMPTFVKISDRSGEVLDIFEVPALKVIKFDGRKENTIEKMEDGSTRMTFTGNHFLSEDVLKGAYENRGVAKVTRLAFMSQLRQALNTLYPKIYFGTTTDQLYISTGRSKNYDYSALDAAQESAIQKLEAGDIAGLTEEIGIWESYLEKYDAADAKAMINSQVAAGLHGNLAAAYLYQDNFEKALDHTRTSERLKQIQTSAVTTETYVSTKKEVGFAGIISHRAEGFKNNSHLTLPEELHPPFDLKKEMAKRKNNKDYNFILTENRALEFYEEYNRSLASAQPEVIEIDPLEKYAAQLQQAGTKYEFLVLNYFDNNDISGGAMPSEITEFQRLHTLQAAGMEFTEIPESIGNMESLVQLNLSQNKLTSLPSSIGKLTNLKTLNLGKNQLTTLPENIKNCTNLKKLVLKDNPISAEEMNKIQSWIPAKCKVK